MHSSAKFEPYSLKARDQLLTNKSLAKENNCKTVAFPCISTGVYHFPKEQAAQIALETVLSNISAPIEKVIFCCFSDSDAEIYRTIYAKINNA